MLGHDGGVDAAAHIEAGGQPHEAGLGRGDQIIENAVGHGFMEGALVPIGPDIQLQGFQFHTVPIRDIFEVQGGEIGLARLGAEAGEFGDVDPDSEIPIGLGIVEGF